MRFALLGSLRDPEGLLGILTVADVAYHYDFWDEKKIDVRQKRFADIASGIWKIDFGG